MGGGYWFYDFFPEEGEEFVGWGGEDCVVLLACACEAKPLFSRVLAGGYVELVKVFVLV